MSGQGPARYRLAGVMGWPIAHSRSPLIHNHWLAERGLAGTYLPLAVPPEKLERALHALHPLGFSGVNLTIPHKVAALSAVDRLDAAARAIGAVNTIVVGDDGELDGFNTDAFGFIASVREVQPAFDFSSGPAVVIGAGGAARAVVHGLLEAGAREIRVVNRTVARASILAEDFGPLVHAYPWAARSDVLIDASIVIQTTALGMEGQPPLDLDLSALATGATVCDIVYVPRRTTLLDTAAQRGNPVVEGLGMLLHQARPAFGAWFGQAPDVTPKLHTLLNASLAR